MLRNHVGTVVRVSSIWSTYRGGDPSIIVRICRNHLQGELVNLGGKGLSYCPFLGTQGMRGSGDAIHGCVGYLSRGLGLSLVGTPYCKFWLNEELRFWQCLLDTFSTTEFLGVWCGHLLSCCWWLIVFISLKDTNPCTRIPFL